MIYLTIKRRSYLCVRKYHQNQSSVISNGRPEEKIRIVLDGLRGEDSISEVCRREGIAPNLYYRWSKDFLEAGKKRLQGDTVREANSGEVSGLKQENDQLKQLVAELSLKNRMLKKNWNGTGSD